MKTRPTQPPAEDAAVETTAPTGQGGSGFNAWLPLVAAVVLMPALAYVMTTFVLLPKMKQTLTAAAGGTEAVAAAAPTAHGEHDSEKPKAGPPGEKQTAQLQKVLVNVAGSMGTRYLVTSLTLVSGHADLTAQVEGHKPQLLDVAAGVLSNKTIEDLEKPGARNVVRSELIAVFNNALGEGFIEDIYITEFAIQ